VGVTRIESNRNRHFGLKIESKSIENRNLEIVTSLPGSECSRERKYQGAKVPPMVLSQAAAA